MSNSFIVKYLDCLKNHTVALGGHRLDGCPQFVPPVGDSPNCVACGCHRAFHRRVEFEVRVSLAQVQPMQAASTSAVTTNAPSASTASSPAPPGAAPVK